jgi:enoyl-CoA hydratase
MNNFEHLLIERQYKGHPHLACITLNRPKVLNALCTPLMQELIQALDELDQNIETRVIILTGSDRAFAAGADISEMSEATAVDQIHLNRFKSWRKIRLIQKPIIAAVNGFALGGGCELAMSCDFILAGDKAQFGQPEIKIGTIPGAGGTQRLTKALGKSKAMYYILTGEMISAQEAFEQGLVAKIFPSETLMKETFEVAKKLAEKSQVCLNLAKDAVNHAFESHLDAGLEYERKNFFLTFASDDQKEGMNAFIEKRSPQFKGL